MLGINMSRHIYDLLILGAGPAGITAAVYAARKKMDFLVISQDIGGQAAWSGDIENYTGYQFITGPELAIKFQEHMDAFGIKVNMPEQVDSLAREKQLIKTDTDAQEYYSKTVIVATGKRPRPLNIAGEAEFKNKGVTYCATCDGPLFSGKAVAIIGGGNSALDAVLQLMNISPKVYLINISDDLTGDPVMVANVRKSENVQIINQAKILRIYGDTFVRGISLQTKKGDQDLAVEGVFVEIGLIPNTAFAQSLSRNPAGEIIVDCYNRTSLKGVFAAGDATNVPEKQIIIACGEGSKACLAAFHYLNTHKFDGD